MDRNNLHCVEEVSGDTSLSARRAWIEIDVIRPAIDVFLSLSARRAWIEIRHRLFCCYPACVALRKESVDRNNIIYLAFSHWAGRSPQGERG